MNVALYRNGKLFATKKAVKTAIQAGEQHHITVQPTSLFGGSTASYTLDQLPIGAVVTFVGPDPWRNRKFYGTVTRTKTKFIVS